MYSSAQKAQTNEGDRNGAVFPDFHIFVHDWFGGVTVSAPNTYPVNRELWDLSLL